MRATRLLGALLVLACAGAPPVRAVVTGSIFGPGSQTLAVAVVPLESKGEESGALGGDFARVLSRDLELSGYFRLIDPKTFVEGAGVAPEAIDYVGWSAIGTQELVKGTIETTGDTVTVEVRLFDVAERRDVGEAGRRFQASRSELPRLAHRYADQLLEVLTGERGPFESKIALISTREGPLKDVYVYTFDMSAPAKLTSERSIVLSPNWQPDHRGVLFTSYRDHQPRLFEIDLRPPRRRPVLERRPRVSRGAWSPDGTQVLASREDAGNSDIELLDRYGAVVRRLTDHWGIDVSPSWSPDGRRFAFCSSRSGAPQIYTMGVSDSEPHRISNTGNYNTSPAWSPKGDRIAWATRSGNTFQIVVANVDGAGARTLTGAGTNEDPSWAPDGRYLVFSSSRSGRRSLWIADRDGRTQKQLTTGNGDDTQPSWSSRLE